MVDKGTFVEQYLEKLYQALQYALNDYARVFAFRSDLRLPHSQDLPGDAMTNRVIPRFRASLEAQINHDRQCANRLNRSAHDSCVRLFWVRGLGQEGLPHYHRIVLLNCDAYRSVGRMGSERTNLYSRLVNELHIPRAATFHLTRQNYLGQDEFFRRSSYLCKAVTKHYVDGQHGCGGSRCRETVCRSLVQ
ncbi:inovirus-type Gp2 protein [Pseudomonas sp. PDM25]|uniref:YagK/YfjJ domain-containing protein n=1 Tax=Pseudomonas sp. PDM25 TaxID=2854772 RepID=UPI001C474D71|nr:inovirus-type Gp2 protein [Pseudomonas sp. PDM25]MBV7515682.1 inovirus Gp2 family protein [Pseudomonas sp. PDM25]